MCNTQYSALHLGRTGQILAPWFFSLRAPPSFKSPPTFPTPSSSGRKKYCRKCSALYGSAVFHRSVAGSRVARTFTSLALRPRSQRFSAVWLEPLLRGPRFGREWRESVVGWAWNHGCGRTSELPGRRDERAGGPYCHSGRGGWSQCQSPFISPPVTSVRGPGPLTSHASEVRASHFTSFLLQPLLVSFNTFLLKTREHLLLNSRPGPFSPYPGAWSLHLFEGLRLASHHPPSAPFFSIH